MEGQTTPASSSVDASFDRLNKDWYIDKAVQVLVFIGGISAIIFIIGIFVFISREGFGFLVGDFNFKEFFFSPNWRPTSESKETFGILALIAGTASVTGLAMLIAIPFSLGAATVSLHPAGHVLGSAQVRIEVGGEVWVVTGDFKRCPDPSCAPFEPVRCDTLITEATFALPVYRWDDPASVAAEIHQWWQQAKADGQTAVLFCYALGKAQRVLAELHRLSDETALLHGAMTPLVKAYRKAGIAMLPTLPVGNPPKGTDFAGRLVLAPPGAAGTPWMRRFAPYTTGFVSGWMRLRGTRRRKAYDRGFVMSDHADWPGLIRTIDALDRAVGIEKVAITIIRRVADPGDTHRGLVDTLQIEPIPNHQAVDLMSIMPHIDATGILVHTPVTHGHIITIVATPKRDVTKDEVIEAFRAHPRIRVVRIADGFDTNTSLFNYARFLGLPEEEVVSAYSASRGATNASAMPVEVVGRQVPTRMIAIAAATVFAVGVIGTGISLLMQPTDTQSTDQLAISARLAPSTVQEIDFAAFQADANEEFSLRAQKSAWIEVRGSDGTVFRSRNMSAGETYYPRMGAGWTITVRDAGAFEWRLGETVYAAVGEDQQALYSLSVDNVLEAARAAQSAAMAEAAAASDQRR